MNTNLQNCVTRTESWYTAPAINVNQEDEEQDIYLEGSWGGTVFHTVGVDEATHIVHHLRVVYARVTLPLRFLDLLLLVLSLKLLLLLLLHNLLIRAPQTRLQPTHINVRTGTRNYFWLTSVFGSWHLSFSLLHALAIQQVQQTFHFLARNHQIKGTNESLSKDKGQFRNRLSSKTESSKYMCA